MSAPIDGFTQFDFADDGIEHAVYQKGAGPGVLAMHEGKIGSYSASKGHFFQLIAAHAVFTGCYAVAEV